MPGASIVDDLEITSSGGAGGSSSAPPPEGRGGGGGGRGGDGDSHFAQRRGGVSRRVYFTGIWLALAAILMFFMALVSAYIVRKGTGGDWRQLAPLPRILWLNTAVLLLSSWALEASHRAWEREDAKAFRGWWATATALGVLFLAGQWVAWRELAAMGVYLATNPSSSFFYVLTAAHGVHLLGGVLALGYVVIHAGRMALRRQRRTALDVTAIYWHFMSALWIYIFFLLTKWA
jgi:cytochrome c oxidase subunit 3